MKKDFLYLNTKVVDDYIMGINDYEPKIFYNNFSGFEKEITGEYSDYIYLKTLRDYVIDNEALYICKGTQKLNLLTFISSSVAEISGEIKLIKLSELINDNDAAAYTEVANYMTTRCGYTPRLTESVDFLKHLFCVIKTKSNTNERVILCLNKNFIRADKKKLNGNVTVFCRAMRTIKNSESFETNSGVATSKSFVIALPIAIYR